MNQISSLYWIGVRESELAMISDDFSGSITFYGSNENNNYAFDKEKQSRIDCNEDSDEWVDFVNTCVARIVACDPNSRFLLYYPADYPFYSDLLKERVVYINESALIYLFENKIRAKMWLSDCATITPYALVEGKHISLLKLQEKFPGWNNFVIQADSSCGGNGTWLYNNDTKEQIDKFIEQAETYIATPYIDKSIPINIHLNIYAGEITLFPASIQIISTHDNCFSYKGADFIAYRHLNQRLQEKVEQQAADIGVKMQAAGYRGICGIDFIATNNDVYFMEINARFQASSMVINRALHSSNKAISLQKLHIDAFQNSQCTYDLTDFVVDYSFHYYTYEKKQQIQLEYLHKLTKESTGCLCIDDGLQWNYLLNNKTYLFELIFKKNITAIGPEFKCIIDSNIDIFSSIISIKNWDQDLFALKIMLLNHGIRLSKRALVYADNHNGLNFEEFEALDLVIRDIYINVPYQSRFAFISPFEIDLNDKNQYILLYWGKQLETIQLRRENALGKKSISNEYILDDFTYLGNDRLRIFFRNGCYYKEKNLGCRFCDIVEDDKELDLSLVKKAINAYKDHPEIKHYLIGGGSNSPSSSYKKIIDLAQYIRSQSDKPIALMSIPPQNLSVLRELHAAGVTEIYFNLEIFDRIIASKYMPGKGHISLETYKNAFQQAVAIWGSTGNVRSAFIVGLEPRTSLLKGIEFVCKLGVSPLLSLFKPIANTPMDHLLPPSNKDIYLICQEALDICKSYNIPLGPSCKYCEDNVLKITP